MTSLAPDRKLFDRKENIARGKDPRIYYPKNAIALDASNSNQIIDIVRPLNAPGSAGYNTPNANTMVRFDHTIATSDSMVDPQASCLVFALRFPRYDAGLVESNYNTAGPLYDSIPFDAVTRIIENIYITSSDTANDVEAYKGANTFSRSILTRYLTELDGDAAEGMDDMFFTPVMEDALDTTAAMSANSILRSQTWCADKDVIHERAIPLSLIFSALDRPMLMANLRKIRMNIQFHASNSFHMSVTGNAGTDPVVGSTGIVVMDCFLYLVSSRMSVSQEGINIKGAAEGAVENLAYLQRVYQPQAFTGGSLQYGAIPHLNLLTFHVSATDANPDRTGVRLINPSQMLPKAVTQGGITFGSGITSYSLRYGPFTIPNLALDLSLARMQVRAYQMYRQACLMCGAKNTRPMISFKRYITCYQLFCISIYDSMALKDTDMAQRLVLDISATNSVNPSGTMIGCQVDVNMHSLAAVSIMPDGSVAVLRETN